ncbi:MAG: tRNA (N(6)-L-threonylcarbamoyladenosine(37)-C(2))-methylthiotransferase MtaB [Clostridia bacterium]|nr:tRNA (N(6)-L-threonylcarbamoyladenosine(37)-C(2))-methylthiotransferase MtaB [Clostridia bacterium]
MRTFAVCALGCRVNQYDAEAIREQLLMEGYEEVPFPHKADVYIVATCTVTGTSDKKSRQMISRAYRANPEAVIVAAGCLAQREPEKLMQLPGVGLVVGSAGRSGIAQKLEEAAQGRKINGVGALDSVFEPLQIGRMKGRTRAALKIQEGCDRHCTYCIIPSVRGPIRSRPVRDALAEAQRLAENGVPEIVLTGIHMTSYGRDLGRQQYPGEMLADLLEGIDSIPGVQRIRMGSVEPALLCEGFMSRVAKLDRFAHQFHVALQSGSDSVLLRMKRGYSTQGYARHIDIVRAYWPEAAISTDMITGFPGETEEEFAETVAYVEKMKLARLHVFPFSPREGTPAAQMPDQLTNEVKQRRCTELIGVGETLRREYMKRFDGTAGEVLFERTKNGVSFGRTSQDIEVEAQGKMPTDRLVTCRLSLAEEGMKAEPSDITE